MNNLFSSGMSSETERCIGHGTEVVLVDLVRAVHCLHVLLHNYLKTSFLVSTALQFSSN